MILDDPDDYLDEYGLFLHARCILSITYMYCKALQSIEIITNRITALFHMQHRAIAAGQNA
jgi:hypothetical protein